MNAAADAYAPPAVRRLMRRISDTQVTLGFPADLVRQYRWRFEDGSFSAWQPAPDHLLVTGPPAARGCEWRFNPQV